MSLSLLYDLENFYAKFEGKNRDDGEDIISISQIKPVCDFVNGMYGLDVTQSPSLNYEIDLHVGGEHCAPIYKMKDFGENFALNSYKGDRKWL